MNQAHNSSSSRLLKIKFDNVQLITNSNNPDKLLEKLNTVYNRIGMLLKSYELKPEIIHNSDGNSSFKCTKLNSEENGWYKNDLLLKTTRSIIYRLQNCLSILKLWKFHEIAKYQPMINNNNNNNNYNNNNNNNNNNRIKKKKLKVHSTKFKFCNNKSNDLDCKKSKINSSQFGLLKMDDFHVSDNNNNHHQTQVQYAQIQQVIADLYNQTNVLVTEKLVAHSKLTTQKTDINSLIIEPELQMEPILESYKISLSKLRENDSQNTMSRYINVTKPSICQSNTLFDGYNCRMNGDNIDYYNYEKSNFDTIFNSNNCDVDLLTDKLFANFISKQSTSKQKESSFSGDEGYDDNDNDCAEDIGDKDDIGKCNRLTTNNDKETNKSFQKVSNTNKFIKISNYNINLSYWGDCHYNSSNSRSREMRASKGSKKVINESSSDDDDDDDEEEEEEEDDDEDEGIGEENDIWKEENCESHKESSQCGRIDTDNKNRSLNCSNINTPDKNDEDDGSDSDGGTELLNSVNDTLNRFNALIHDTSESSNPIKDSSYWYSNGTYAYGNSQMQSLPPKNKNQALHSIQLLKENLEPQNDKSRPSNLYSAESNMTSQEKQIVSSDHKNPSQLQPIYPYIESSHSLLTQPQQCHQYIITSYTNQSAPSVITSFPTSSVNSTTSITTPVSSIKAINPNISAPNPNWCNNYSDTTQCLYKPSQQSNTPNTTNNLNILNNMVNFNRCNNLNDSNINYNATLKSNESYGPTKKWSYSSLSTGANTGYAPAISFITAPSSQSPTTTTSSANSSNIQLVTGPPHTLVLHHHHHHQYPAPHSTILHIQSPNSHIYTAAQPHSLNTTTSHSNTNHHTNDFYQHQPSQQLTVVSGALSNPQTKVYCPPRNTVVTTSNYRQELSNLIINTTHTNYQQQSQSLSHIPQTPTSTNELTNRNNNIQFYTNPSTNFYQFSTNTNNTICHTSPTLPSCPSSCPSPVSSTHSHSYSKSSVVNTLEKSQRACCFYMRGGCKKEDCEYAHDLSKVTCKFWEKGDCFKSDTCPFKHGYVDNNISKPI